MTKRTRHEGKEERPAPKGQTSQHTGPQHHKDNPHKEELSPPQNINTAEVERHWSRRNTREVWHERDMLVKVS